MEKPHLCFFLVFLFHIFSTQLSNFLWPFGNCDKWHNSEQISKSNNFKLWSVYLTNGKAGKVLSAQGNSCVVKLLEHTHLCESLTIGHQVQLGHFHWLTIRHYWQDLDLIFAHIKVQ